MARGFIAGVIVGLGVVAVVAGGVSLAIDPPDARHAGAGAVVPRNAPPVEEDVIPGTVEIVREPTEAETAEATGAGAEEQADTVEPAADGSAPPDASAETTDGADEPGRRPVPETAVERVDTPGAPPAVPGNEAPATPETRAPAMPRADVAPTTLPEAPSAPPATLSGRVPGASDSGPEQPRAQAALPDLARSGPDTPPAQPPAPPAPTIESPLAEGATGSADAPAPVDEASLGDAVTQGEAADRAAPGIPEDEAPNGAPLEDGAADDSADAPEAGDSTTAEDDATPAREGRPLIGEPATAPGDRAQQASRLPRIGDPPADAEAASPASPLETNAVPVDVDPELPRVAVVLIDDGRGPLGPDALQAFPFPVSFAIDPAHPNPAGAAQAYRDLGFEVLALARVPEGAQPQDVEVALGAALDAVPGAVAVIEPPEGGLQADRDIAAQVASFLAQSGHGLVSAPQGLNTGEQIAMREGVPAVTLFRDFDSNGQDARVIRRFLDQGAFRAGQEGAVVMLGRLRADTISALVLWGLQDRAQSVALVPISVVLRETQAE